MLRFLADQNFNGNITRGVLRERPTIDLLRAQDVGVSELPDPEVLEWAAQEDRIVLTHDRNTMTGDAIARIRGGRSMPGLFVADDDASPGPVIADILLADALTEMSEWRDKIVYLPL